MKNILLLCLLLFLILQENPSHFIHKETKLILLSDEEMQCITGTGSLVECSEEIACAQFYYVNCYETLESGDPKCNGYSVLPNYTAHCNTPSNENMGCFEFSSYCSKLNVCSYHEHDPLHGPSDCNWGEEISDGETTVCVNGC